MSSDTTSRKRSRKVAFEEDADKEDPLAQKGENRCVVCNVKITRDSFAESSIVSMVNQMITKKKLRRRIHHHSSPRLESSLGKPKK